MQYQYKGLSSTEVIKNQKEFGFNIIPGKKEDTLFIAFLKQFQSPLIYILLIVSLITLALHEYSDSVVIVIVVIVNSIIGTVQTRKANSVLKSLKNLSRAKVKVIREGTLVELSMDQVTIGDHVFLAPGDIVPADGSLLESNNLRINESKINGESLPVSKNDADNMVYRSTVVISGTGILKVEKIGVHTIIGGLSKSILENVGNETIIEKKMRKLISLILYFILSAVLVIFVFGIAREMNILELFKTSVSLTVSAIPEGLPIVLTIVFAVGAWRITKVKGLLKNLPSGATLATVSYICTDKTGTLTEGDISVKDVISLDELDKQLLNQFLVHSLDIKEVSNDKIGDILDLKMSEYLGIEQSWQETKELPFVSENKYNAKEYLVDDQHIQVYKGAPELFLINSDLLDKYVHDGFRVLCVSYKKVEPNTDFDTKGTTPVALVIFEDKIRHDVKTAIHECKSAGVSIMMITGDNINTAKHVAREVKILTGHKDEICLLGSELASYTDDDLSSIIDNLKVIARANPADKLRIVKILQDRGEIVAMTGDGVNDGPSIALADIGISMGKTGTEVAKEAADFILIDDNFTNIRDGIFEARTIVENIKKTLIFLLSTSLGEIVIIGSSIIAGLPLPLLPAQILWLNLITDGFLDVSLANEKAEDEYRTHNFKRYQGNILNKNDWTRIFLMAFTMASVSLYFFVFIIKIALIEIVRTLMLVVMSVFQWLNAINVRKAGRSIFSYNIFDNKFITGALILEAGLLFAGIYSHWGQTLLRTVSIDYQFILIALLISLPIIAVDEIYKFAIRRK